MKNLSIYYKMLFIFTFTIMVSVGAVGYYGLQSAAEAYLDSANKMSEQNTQALKIEIEKKLENVPKDISYLTNFYALKYFLIWREMNEPNKEETWKQVFSDAILDFLYTRKNYYKIRIIDLQGNELVNAQYDKVSDTTVLLDDNDLQNKSKRYYFKEALKLKKGEFFISNMDLNKEHGKILKPYIPVVRYATPIVNGDDENVAILVLSMYADDILNVIETKDKTDKVNGFEYFLVDKDFNYLYDEDVIKRWNAQLQNGFNFRDEYFHKQNLFKDREKGIFSYEGSIYSFEKVYPLSGNKENYWYIIAQVKESLALAKLDNFKIIFALIILAVLIGSLITVRSFIFKITYPLSKVTAQLAFLANGEIKKESISYHSNDEIGEIVHSTARLVEAMQTVIRQANDIANGNFSKEVVLLSQNDELGNAISNMTERLKEITVLAKRLSIGDYSTSFVIQGTNDKLGIALVEMIEYFETITQLTESIAKGKLDIEYKIKGEEDKLGFAVLKLVEYLQNILKQANAISRNDFSSSIEVQSKDDELSRALITMTDILRASYYQNKKEIFISEGISKFNSAIVGINDIQELSKNAITTLCHHVEAKSGVVYIVEENKEILSLIASYAFSIRANLANRFKVGEGIVGQVALEKEEILLTNISDELIIQSATTSLKPKNIYTLPIMHEEELFGVLEIVSLEEIGELEQEYLRKVIAILATALFTAKQNSKIKELLEKSQRAYEELQASNEQMEEQQEELREQSNELQEKNEVLAQAKEEIRKRAQEIEKASQYKSEFLANMSHELRTPLNSIILLSKLLSQNQEKNMDQKEIEQLEVIHKAGQDLLELINDILDLTKVESGKMELEFSEVTSKELVKELEGLFSEIAKEKHLKLLFKDNYQKEFVTDKTKLLQVLKNLLSNALKFTKEGEVSLEIKQQNNKLILEVKDSGIGIPKEKLKTIFEAFKQVDGSISREFGGTGLGLSISKTIVELMDGELEVESKEGQGSTFRVVLPLEKPLKKEEQSQEHSWDEELELLTPLEDEALEVYKGKLTGKNILLVDDDSRNIFAFTSLLESMDAEVFSAFNGQEALEILEDEDNIDLVILDIMMPVKDGLETIKEIRRNEKYKDLPIIVVTAKNMQGDREKCLDLGANEYLVKPIKNETLINMIEAWID